MRPLNKANFQNYVDQQIRQYHNAKLESLEKLSLKSSILRRKNPYLLRAKDAATAEEFIRAALEAILSSSEEERFGELLERIAVFISEQTADGRKSSAEGIDLEFDSEDVRYLVSIKSSPNWGNSSQQKRLKQNFEQALKIQRQARSKSNIQAILGICYGRAAHKDKGIYQIVVGQRFWEFLSGDPDLYVALIEPIGTSAHEQNQLFRRRLSEIELRLIKEFTAEFCTPDGQIDWIKVVKFNSGE